MRLVFDIIKTPGPGAYSNIQQFNSDGTYSLSRFNRVSSTLIREEMSTPIELSRANTLIPDNKNPGPGHYNTKQNDLYSSLSKQKSRLGIAALKVQFGSAERIDTFKPKSNTPGPGEYQSSSAFGHYISK